MKILFLGTGAADWPNCPESDVMTGDRRFSSLIIDGKLLVDVAPQSFAYAQKIGVDFSKITDIFITHTHGDHLSEVAIMKWAEACTNKLNLWCHVNAANSLRLSEKDKEEFNIRYVDVMKTYETAGYQITVLEANHIVEGSPETALHYIFETPEKRLFHGCDGGWFVARTWEFMRTGYRAENAFDALILDATVGDKDGDFRLGTHNSVPMLRLIKAALIENSMTNDNTLYIANHLARTLHPGVEETTAIFAKEGMIVAADGMEIEI